MTCQHTMTLGVYLLGALDPAERSEFEAHLSGCETCRGELVRLAPLPGLLNQISPGDFADDLPPTAVEPTLPAQGRPSAVVPVAEPFPSVLPREPEPVLVSLPDGETRDRFDELAGRRRAKRYRQVAGAAAVVVVLTIGGIFSWRAIREPVEPPRAEGVTWSATAPDGDVRASARLVDHEWGTEIQAKVANLPPGKECYLVVYDHYGHRQITGWWGTDHDPEEEIPASTSIHRSKISRLELKLDEDTVVLVLPAPRR